MSVRAHYAALHDLLKAELPTSYAVYKFTIPAKPPLPYVLIWGDMGQESGESLAGTTDHLDMRPRVTYGGQTGDSVMAVVDKVRDVLRDRMLAVAGWSPSRLSQARLQGAQEDPSVTIEGTASHPVFAVDEFPFTSQRS